MYYEVKNNNILYKTLWNDNYQFRNTHYVTTL